MSGTYTPPPSYIMIPVPSPSSDIYPLPDSLNTFVDLSGTSTPITAKLQNSSSPFPDIDQLSNPYNAMIFNCDNQSTAISQAYDTHRRTRNAQCRTKLLTDPTPIKLDQMLLRSHVLQDGTVDHRNCLVLWARPPLAVRNLITGVQERLKAIAPNIWLMPPPNLHMTVLEVTHSQTPEVVADLIDKMGHLALHRIANHTFNHRAKLVKPILSFDGSACAISFVPASGPSSSSSSSQRRDTHDYSYTYQHLRRDVFDLCKKAGAKIESRYQVPSAHVTIARFITTEDHVSNDKIAGISSEMLTASSQADVSKSVPIKIIGKSKIQKWVQALDEINEWLNSYEGPGTEWIIGEEQGLDFRSGRLWYGGGQTEALGKGF